MEEKKILGIYGNCVFRSDFTYEKCFVCIIEELCTRELELSLLNCTKRVETPRQFAAVAKRLVLCAFANGEAHSRD